MILFILGIYLGVFFRYKNLVEEELLQRARSHFQNIVLTRKWNAQFGGVFVEKTVGIESNSYLENPDITAIDGTVYTKKTPELMTREISELTSVMEENKNYIFHITSLIPLNPNNKPDDFERNALNLFEEGQTEFYSKEKIEGVSYYRYIAPLLVNESCLLCHAKQGYKVGDIRGGIGIRFNIENIQKQTQENFYIFFAIGLLSVLTILTIIYLFIFNFMKKLTEAQQQLREMAITDELTSLYNRRFFFLRIQEEFERSKRYNHHLSCIMIDIDFFKKVNDQYGHQVGDEALKKVSQTLKDNTRISDTVARFGGEEFIALFPQTNEEEAKLIAEKYRLLIEKMPIFITPENKIKITISAGVATFSSDNSQEILNHDDLIKRADHALYNAKSNGRNRVESD